MIKRIPSSITIVIALVCLVSNFAWAQTNLFTPLEASPYLEAINKEVGSAYFFRGDKQEFENLAAKKPNQLSFNLDLGFRQMAVKAISAEPLSPTFRVTAATKPEAGATYTPGAFYQGSIQHTDSKIAAISFFPDGSAMAVLADETGNWVLGLLNDEVLNPNKDVYILYNDVDLKLIPKALCNLEDDADMQKTSADPAEQIEGTNSTCRKVTVYFECDNTMYRDNASSIVNTTNLTTGLFNVVAQLYDNENIFVEISEIKVWDITDPHVACANSSCYLNAFNTRMNNEGFNGNLAHFLTTRNSGMGGIAWLPGLCSANRKTAFSNINNGYSLLPSYSWSVMVVAHELGHNFNSPHTQNCNWIFPGGRRGSIDSCYAAEGNCFTQTRARAGTIMSYCHLNGSINLNLGFGPLPGNRIRQSFQNGNCISGTEIIPQFFPASNSPLCDGDTLRLSTNLVPNATYRWTGPDGFVSTLPTTERLNFSTSSEGEYNLVVSRNGCNSRARMAEAELNCLVIGHPSLSEICAGSRLRFAFTTKARFFGPGNVFRVELSDPLGNFTNPTVVGSVSSSNPTEIPALIPYNLPFGSRYRFRITSTVPSNFGLDGDKNYRINSLGALPNIADGFRCSPGVVNISTSGSAYTFWYDSLYSQVALGWSNAANPFKTSFIQTERTYIAQNSSASIVSAGPATNTMGNGTFEPTPGKFLRLNITSNLLFDSVTVFTNNTGTITINLRDSLGNLMNTVSRPILAPGRNRIYVGMYIFNGRKYRLDATGSTVNLFANSAGAVYPYNSTVSSISIFGNSDNNNSYPYFYGLRAIRTLFCPTSPREVRAYISNEHPNITPTIRQFGDSLTVDPAGQNYQWFYEGNQISTSSRTFRPAVNGNYTVRILADSCSTPASSTYNYLITSISYLSGLSNSTVKVFPQPASQRVTLESAPWANSVVDIQIFDLSGKQLQTSLQQADAKGAVELGIQLPKGIYLAKSTSKGSKAVVKLLVD